MSLSIEVEVNCGDRIEGTAEEMVALSSKLNIMVTVNFNGVHLVAYKDRIPPSAIVSDYHSELESKFKEKDV